MKGIILAGGKGSRLFPLTKITNKHLLPIYDQPMIYYPIQALVESGVRDILIVTGGSYAGDFLQLLGTGRQLGIDNLSYTFQEGEGGIADALRLAEHFSDGQKDILTQFLLEALMISVAGCLIGLVLGIAGALLTNAVTDMVIVISGGSILVAFGVAAGIGIFFGYYPAHRASGLDPIEALRHQ